MRGRFVQSSRGLGLADRRDNETIGHGIGVHFGQGDELQSRAKNGFRMWTQALEVGHLRLDETESV
jgi:hypothetical protein